MRCVSLKNILMVTMSLDIGGAETHIIELSCALKQKGYNIICASRGGAYVAVLERAGIRHYEVPLTSKHPKSIVAAKKLLGDIIDREKIDVVHAHARIPAFICHTICKKKNIAFVTTAHGAYSTGSGLKYVTRWGQKTLAVSEDIKSYLLNNYKINEKDITLTINGINSEKFTDDPPDETVFSELGISSRGKNIMYLGRINFDSGEYAFRLASLAPKIAEVFPDANIIIVGSGDRFEELKALSDKINASLPRKTVFLAGARTDVARMLSVSDLVVSVSRAALEAMSCKKRVLLASDFGYMGNYSEEKLSDCIKNNFTCRGFEKPSDDVFFSDIISALNDEPEKTKAITESARQMIIENYSIDRMAQDAINIYNSVDGLSYGKQYDFLILGYYGFNNSGDDALLEAVIHNLLCVQPGLSICVLSNMPEKLRSELNIDSFHRFNIFSVIGTIRRSKVLIYGGGNLIQDVTSTKSLLYYVLILYLAQILGTRTMLYSNGVGPVNRPMNRKIVSKILNNVDVITLREKISLNFLSEIGVTKPEIHETADITLTMSAPNDEKTDELFENEGIDKNEKYMCVSVRNWPKNPKTFEDDMSDVLDEIYDEYGIKTLFVPLHEPHDREISARIMAKMKSPAFMIKNTYNAQNLIGLMSRAELVSGMRLHSMIFASAANAKICGIVYDEKVRGFLDSVNSSDYINVENFNKEEYKAVLERVIKREKDEAMIASYDVPKARALLNSEYAIKLLKR